MEGPDTDKKNDFDNNISPNSGSVEKEDPYDVKFKDLQKYVPFLRMMIKKLEGSADRLRDAQLTKMRNLYAILSNPKKRLKSGTLEKCEDILKKFDEKLKFSIPSAESSSTPVRKVKTEKEDCIESPASPPKADLTAVKSIPKIIPVERCATVEKDFSNSQESPSLEASRERLKGVMNSRLEKDLSSLCVSTRPPPPPTNIQTSIPGLDMVFPCNLPSVAASPLVPDSTVCGPKLDDRQLPVSESKWQHTDSDINRPQSNTSKDRTSVDITYDWRKNQTNESMQFRRDFDERRMVSSRSDVRSDPRLIQSPPVMVPPPLLRPLISSVPPCVGAPPVSSSICAPKDSSQDTRTSRSRWSNDYVAPVEPSSRRDFVSIVKDVPQLPSWGAEASTPSSSEVHQPRSSWTSDSSNSFRRGKWNADLNVPSRESRPPHSSRTSDTGGSTHSWMADAIGSSPKEVHPSRSDKFSDQTPSLGPKFSGCSTGQSEGHPLRPGNTARSLREKFGQDLDKVEKLGKSTGGALRTLKSDPRFSRRDDFQERGRETDAVGSEELRLADATPRLLEPRRDPRRSSLDTQLPPNRVDPRIVRESLPITHKGPNSVVQGSHTIQQEQWSHSRMTAPSTSSTVSYQGNRTVIPITPGGSTVTQNTFHWQSTTTTIKVTTAHDLGCRYKPKHKRSQKFGEEKEPDRRGTRRPESKDDGKGLHPKEKTTDKSSEADVSSPLNRLFSGKVPGKSAHGLGIQNFKIPKIIKAPSPLKDVSPPQPSLRPSDPRMAASRDPRLAKSLSRPLSPSDSASNFDILLNTNQKESLFKSNEGTPIQAEQSISHGKEKINCISLTTQKEPEICSAAQVTGRRPVQLEVKVRPGSPQSDSVAPKVKERSPSRSRANSRDRSSSRSRVRSPSQSRARNSSRSRARSSSRSRARSSSRSRARSSSRSRGISPVRSPSHPRRKSRARSPSCRSTSRSKSRERSYSHSRNKSSLRGQSRSRGTSRGRSSSRTRGKSRGRSPRSRAKSRGRSFSRSRSKKRRSSSRSRERSRGRSSSRSRAISRSRSSSQASSRGRSPSRSRGKSRGRSISRLRAISRERSSSRSRAKSRGRSSSLTRAKSRGRSKSRSRTSSRSRAKSRGRSLSRSRRRSRDRRSTSKSRRSVSSSRNKSRETSPIPLSPSRSNANLGSSPPGSQSPCRENIGAPRSTRTRDQSRQRSTSRTRRHSRSRSITSERSQDSEGRDRRRNERGSSSPKRQRKPRGRRGNRYSQDRHRSKSRSRSASKSPRRRRKSYERSSKRSSFRRTDSSHRGSRDKRITSRRYSRRVSSGSSRSSSSSDRSNASSFRVNRSRSRSPCRELVLPSSAKDEEKKEKEREIGGTNGQSAAMHRSAEPLLPIQKEVVESSTIVQSSRSEVNSTVADNMLDLPSSTSGNTPETPVLERVSDMASMEKANTRNTPSPPLLKPESSAGMLKSNSGDTSNTILELLKQALAKPQNLIALTTSMLPEAQRAKVLEIFKEAGTLTDVPAEEKPAPVNKDGPAEEKLSLAKNPNDVIVDEKLLSTRKVDDVHAEGKPALAHHSKKSDKDASCSNQEQPNKFLEAQVESEATLKSAKVAKKVKKAPAPKFVEVSQKKGLELSPDTAEKQPKSKKRNELEKLHEDIREMFISKEVVTATGHRSCRIKNENKLPVVAPASSSNSNEEKGKLLKSKGRKDDAADVLDVIPTKPDCLSDRRVAPTGTVTLNPHNPICITSESEDDAFERLKQEWGKSSNRGTSLKRKRRMCFPDSESESENESVLEINTNNNPTSCQPRVILEKTDLRFHDVKSPVECMLVSRNVARRGRKVGSLSRDHKKVQAKHEITITFVDMEPDIDMIESVRTEDKDMSLIDTSNIIQVEHSGAKLTRNQLKLLKGPDMIKQEASTSCGTSHKPDSSESESNISPLRDSGKDACGSSDSGVQPKKRKNLKQISPCQRGFSKKRNCGKPTKTEGSQFSSNQDNVDDVTMECDGTRLNSSMEEEKSNNTPPIMETDSQGTEPSKFDGHNDLNYVFQKEKTHCKLCSFFGKNIVQHYVSIHPEHEVYVSRLPEKIALLVKSQSDLNDGKCLNKLKTEDAVPFHSTCSLKCILCGFIVVGTVRLFDHVSTHTGEYRYGCKICNFKAACRKSVKYHMIGNHSSGSGPCEIFFKAPPSTKPLFGYLCSSCNFFQLQEAHLEKHLKHSHPDAPLAHSIQFRIGLQSSENSKVCINPEETSGNSKSSEEIKLSSPEIDHELETKEDIKNPKGGHQEDIKKKLLLNAKENVVTASSTCCELKGNENPASLLSDISAFISSELVIEDECQKNEQRKQILKDASKKIQDRPKIRNAISDRLAQRLVSSESFPSYHCSSDGDKCKTPLIPQAIKTADGEAQKKETVTAVRTSLRSSSTRLNSKTSEGSERRFTRSLSRNVLGSSDSDSSSIPDEMKTPLPFSTLSDTLQRMQETLTENTLVKPTGSNVPTTPEISFDSEFISTEKIIRVGLVEVIVVDGSENLLYICRSSKCVFTSTQAILFLKHTETAHPRISYHAPCSLCKEQSTEYRDLCSSFMHLVTNHLQLKAQDKNLYLCPSEPLSKTLATSLDWNKIAMKSTLIRPRILPGDTLSERRSTTEECDPAENDESDLPQLVISSVVSLSKDHTPDGVPLEGPASILSHSSSHLQHSSQTRFLDPGPSSFHNKTDREDASSSTTSPSGSFKKDSDSLKRMKTPFKLCHLFKCMSPRCSFTTDLKGKFAEHYQKHLMLDGRQNFNAAEWQRCLYCGALKTSGESLTNHILMEHGFLKYQCSYCFYRAACKENVSLHQKLDHMGQPLMVWECSVLPVGKKCKVTSPVPPTQCDIQPYQCAQDGECKMKFIAADDLVSHINNKHPADHLYRCCVCNSSLINAEALICHYSSSHQYCMYHCLHCSKAAETQNEIRSHMCHDHPDKYLHVGARITCPDQSIVDRCVLVSENIQMCVLNLADNAGDDKIILKIHEASVSDEMADFSTDSPPDGSKSLPQSVFFPVIKNTNELLGQSKDETLSVKGKTVPLSDTVNSTLPKDKIITDGDKLIKSCHEAVPSSGLLNEITNQSSCNKLSLSTKSLEVVDLIGSALYLCGYAGCTFKAENSASLKDHLLSCDMARGSPNLNCPHCPRMFKNALQMMDHLPKHSVLRYMCSLCDFAARVPTTAITHLRQKHKGVTSHQILPLDPLHPDLDTALYSVRPKDSSLKKGKTKLLNPFGNKSIFGPEERQSLPSRAVFKSDVHCALCNYSTKVRSNMMRHLDQHSQGCVVSSVPVVNPVPNRQEKMFDTMTNHAISSTIPVRRDSNAFRVSDEPKFVPENKRFVCCAPACQYVTSDDTMLRHHIRVLHADVFFYKCPHCPDIDSDSTRPSILLEKLGSHLRMHDSRLYSCISCSYYHYQRHIVERHTAEKHPDQTLIRVIREPKPEGPNDTENIVDLESEIASSSSECQNLWECNICEVKGCRADVISHVASAHRIQSQFKCRHCPYRTSNRSRFPTHFANKHPERPEDFIAFYRKSERSLIEPNQKQSEVPPPPSPIPSLPVSSQPTPPIVVRTQYDSTPLWRRDASRMRHLRGILFEENGLKPKELERFDVDSPENILKRRAATDFDGNGVQMIKKDKKDENIKKVTGRVDAMKKPSSHLCDTAGQANSSSSSPPHPEKITSEASVLDVRQKQEASFYSFNFEKSSSEQLQKVNEDLHGGHQSSERSQSTEGHTKLTKTTSKSSLAGRSPCAGTVVKSPEIPMPCLKSEMQNKVCKPMGSPEKLLRKSPTARFVHSANVVEHISSSTKVGMKSILKPALTAVSQTSLPVSIPSDSQSLETTRRLLSSPVKAKATTYNVGDTSSSTESAVMKSPFHMCTSSEDEHVDESAFELDIEEVEDTEPSDCGTRKHQTALGELSDENILSPGEYECKYMDKVGCKFISKTKKGAYYHEMKHWETKPFQCGYCEFQGIQVSIVKMHCRKRHPSLDIKFEKNELPDVPTIVPIQSKRKSETCQDLNLNQSSNTAVSQEEIDENERLFKNIQVYRCLYCRLRDTSLSRLLRHWRNNHRDQEAFQEDAPDGRKIVPFKYKEVKLGSHEKETMAFRCGSCMKSGSIKALKEHHSSRHVGITFEIKGLVHDRLQCALCPRQFSSKLALGTHFSSAHPGETARTSKIMKPSDQDTTMKLETTFGCLYCREHVLTEIEMVDHHLKFHSHLEPKYMEIEESESEAQEMGTYCDFETTPSNGNSGNPTLDVAVSSRQSIHTVDVKADNTHSKTLPSLKRCVARKSTSKVRAVARKSTGGRTTRKVFNFDVDSNSSDNDSSEEGFSYYQAPRETIDDQKISCPVMFDGTMSRVKLATMAQFSNFNPVILLEDIKNSHMSGSI